MSWGFGTGVWAEPRTEWRHQHWFEITQQGATLTGVWRLKDHETGREDVDPLS